MIITNRYILDFIYLMPWKFDCNLRFHEVLKATIIRQITKGNEKLKKQSKTVVPLTHPHSIIHNYNPNTHTHTHT